MSAIRFVAVGYLLWSAVAAAQDEPNWIGAPRMRSIAQQMHPPGPLTLPQVKILDTVADAVDHSTLDVAAERFARFLEQQLEAGHKGVPTGYIDYVLHGAAVAGSVDAAAASARATYFLAQENAVLEHLSLLEKQHSDRAGSRLPDFVLREPVLGEFGQDEDPVRRGLPQPANTDQLPDRIASWRDTLDRIGRLRLDAVTDFDAAVRADPELHRRLVEADVRLAGVVQDVFGTTGR